MVGLGKSVSSILDHWENARDTGLDVTIPQLCAAAPHLEKSVAEKISRLEALENLIGNPEGKCVAPPSKPTSPALQVPSSLIGVASFRDLQRLDRGSLGEIYRAHDVTLHRPVAVKILRWERSNDPIDHAKLLREAEIASRLEHPSVITIYSAGRTDDQRPYYAMRLIDGDSMKRKLAAMYRSRQNQNDKATTHRLRRLLCLFSQACRGVEHAHYRGILHRDLKPANIMTDRYGHAYVIDWGIADSIGRTGRFKISKEKTLIPSTGRSIGSSRLCGSPFFMSPEALNEQELGPSSDIYSLGICLYQIATGQLPFRAKSYASLRAQILQQRYLAPAECKPGVPARLDAIIRKAISRNPAHRQKTAGELADDVDDFLRQPANHRKRTWVFSAWRWSTQSTRRR